MPRISADHLAQLTQRYRRVKHVRYNGHDLVFRKPSRLEIQAHREQQSSDNRGERVRADEDLQRVLIVQVDGVADDPGAVRAAYNDLLDDYPYLANEKAVGIAVAQLTGVVQDEAEKK